MNALDGFTGISFPFRIDPGTGGVATSTTSQDNYAHIEEAVRQIIGTSPALREVWHLPDFGARPPQLEWEPLDEAFAGAVETTMRTGLARWEDRVRFEVVTTLRASSEGQLIIHIEAIEPITYSRVQVTVEVPS